MTKSIAMRIGAGVLTATLFAMTGGVLSAGAAGGPKLTVTPSTNLKNGETVTVTGSGFKKGDSVYVVECLVHAKGGSQCNELGATPATISSTGLLPKTKFSVSTGTIGTGKCGTTPANLAGCAISVGNISGGDSASFTIKFK